MKELEIWRAGLGLAALPELDPGFWVAIAVVASIVVVMNAVLWGMKPKGRRNSEQ